MPLQKTRTPRRASARSARPVKAALALGGRGVILGTISVWRRALFKKNFPGITISCMSADIDERAVGGTRVGADAQQLSCLIAHAKADVLVRRLRGERALLLTMDQLVLGPEGVREKPRDADECRRFLRSYAQGAPVTTFSAVVAVDSRSGRRFDAVDVASQWFHPFPDEVIEQLIAEGDCLNSAGGILVEHELLVPYQKYREGELESIQGLPLGTTGRLLEAAAAAGNAYEMEVAAASDAQVAAAAQAEAAAAHAAAAAAAAVAQAAASDGRSVNGVVNGAVYGAVYGVGNGGVTGAVNGTRNGSVNNAVSESGALNGAASASANGYMNGGAGQ